MVVVTWPLCWFSSLDDDRVRCFERYPTMPISWCEPCAEVVRAADHRLKMAVLDSLVDELRDSAEFEPRPKRRWGRR